jgi:hypothetical protein
MNLNDAEVEVTTQREIEKESLQSDMFQLSDFGDTSEFYSACCSHFNDEKNPVFRYQAWDNIPDILINKEWFCPNFFEIRDAFECLEEPEVDYFMSWCNYHGHNIATDDPHLLVTNYLDNNSSHTVMESESVEVYDDSIYQNASYSYFDIERYSLDIFSDNYD